MFSGSGRGGFLHLARFGAEKAVDRVEISAGAGLVDGRAGAFARHDIAVTEVHLHCDLAEGVFADRNGAQRVLELKAEVFEAGGDGGASAYHRICRHRHAAPLGLRMFLRCRYYNQVAPSGA